MLDKNQIERLMKELRTFYVEVPNFQFNNAYVSLSDGGERFVKLRLKRKTDLGNLIQLLKFIKENESFKMTKYF